MGYVREAALEGQSPSRALPKACVCRRERRGRQYEKGSEIRMNEQARPSDSGPFSCRLVVWLRLRGNAVSLRRNEREKRRSKMAELTPPAPKRQSAERRAAGFRSKLKKTEKIMGSSLLESLRFSVFFN